MTDDEAPIAWLALEEGTTVYSADGDELGSVRHVVADEQKDIFSGIVFRSGILSDDRFVPADAVETITTAAVRLGISSEEADRLEPYAS